MWFSLRRMRLVSRTVATFTAGRSRRAACSRETESQKIDLSESAASDLSIRRAPGATPRSCQDYVVQLLLDQAPPQPSVKVPWRELYVGGAFGQRELADDSDMSRAAKERGLDLWAWPRWPQAPGSARSAPARPTGDLLDPV
jgi:hypothetical protein